jgi:uncharacterized membrane-anchored protein
MAKKIVLVATVFILGIVNWSIMGKETHLTQGRIVYLELAPVDPRSLMQGDYMALRFKIANAVHQALPKADRYRGWRQAVDASDGYVVVRLDARQVGSFKGLDSNQALSEDELRLRFRVRSGEVKFATNAFFFQEGHAQYYTPAKYGQFRVDDRGELLLVAMYDKDLKRLGPAAKE